jgi:hypothetical protein
MAQYSLITSSSSTWIYLSDGTSRFRVRVTGDEMFYDQAKTATAWSGASPTHWENIDSSTLPGTNLESFRIGARDLRWREDQEITASPGFSGTEGVDWDNISDHGVDITTTTTSTTT